MISAGVRAIKRFALRHSKPATRVEDDRGKRVLVPEETFFWHLQYVTQWRNRREPRWSKVPIVAFILLCTIPVVMTIVVILAFGTTVSIELRAMLWGLIGLYLAMISFAWWWIRPSRHESVRLSQLTRRCVHCDYDLRGVAHRGAGECPECGTAFQDAIDLADARFARIPPKWKWIRWAVLFMLLPMALWGLWYVSIWQSRFSSSGAYAGTGGFSMWRPIRGMAFVIAVYFLIAGMQHLAIRRSRRPANLRAFLQFGRCPACLNDLLLVEPDPADGCRVCPHCGGAWRLEADTNHRSCIGRGAECH